MLQILASQRARLTADDVLAQSEAQVNISAIAIYKALGGIDQ